MMSIASEYIAAVFPIVLAVFYVIQHRTSRQMRFLDIEHKAPLKSIRGEGLGFCRQTCLVCIKFRS